MNGIMTPAGFDIENRTVTLRDAESGRLFTMDLGQSDVHVDAILSNYITGYRNGEMIADVVAPPVVVNKSSNKFFQLNPDNAMATVDGTDVAPGGDVPEINPQLSNTRYSTIGRSLASFLPMEIIANQDAPLNIQQVATRMVMDKLLLNREVRVKNLAYTTAFAAANIVTLGATTKWNGGANADPVRNIRAVMEASLMPVTHMAMSLDTWHAFTENPAVQKYVAFKSAAAPLPNKTQYEQWAALLDMPIPVIAQARAKTSAGVYPYVWATDVSLFRMPPGNSISDMDITTFKTFRWNGAGSDTLPTEFGGTVQGGWTVRSFYNFTRGPRGGMTVIVTHNDAEQAIATQVGGVILNAFS